MTHEHAIERLRTERRSTAQYMTGHVEQLAKARSKLQSLKDEEDRYLKRIEDCEREIESLDESILALGGTVEEVETGGS